jgi:hypothetical protein
VPARWAIEALDIIEHVLPCLITRVIGLRAIRSVLSEEQKLSIAALSQTFPERLIEHMADLNMGILQRFTENVDAAVTKQAIGMPARLCPALPRAGARRSCRWHTRRVMRRWILARRSV